MKFLCALAILAVGATAAPGPSWTLVQNADFEIYSQSGIADSSATLLWFEQLRAFFASNGLAPHANSPVRIIGFRSAKEYDSYRLRPTADAYYVGTDSRDYIVMPALDANHFGMAAHEYAHLILHADGLHLPAWLNEGLAEFFSTVRISRTGCELGAAIRTHSQALRLRTWMPLSRLLETGPDALERRDESEMFYAQSWALTEMLLLSPEYRTRFPELIASLSSGVESRSALTRVYGRSLEAITGDMQVFVSSGTVTPLTAPGVAVQSIKATSSELTQFAARSMLGELLLASGELNRAEAQYVDLARQSPGNAEVSAALGTIALRKGDLPGAQLKWKHALEQGIKDAGLCYRYAVIADDAGAAADEIRPALERAIALKPDFDDAHFKLALLQSNASKYESAIEQLGAMRTVTPERRFGYWRAMAYAQNQLGNHADSKISAEKALRFAATEHERAEATQLAYVADTELTVRFTRDANGNPQMTTTRVARGTESWNPFVEPQDRMRRAEGQLRMVECGNEKVTGIAVDTAEGSLKLSIPDPLHVLIRGATEFTCGAQPASPVTVEYAVSANSDPPGGVLRGMEIRPPQQTH